MRRTGFNPVELQNQSNKKLGLKHPVETGTANLLYASKPIQHKTRIETRTLDLGKAKNNEICQRIT